MQLTRRDFVRAASLSLAGVAVVGAGPSALAEIAGAFAAQAPPGERLRLAVLWPQTPAQRLLAGRLDDTHAVVDGGVEVLLWPGDEARIIDSGMPYRISVDDLSVGYATTTSSATPAGGDDYASLDQLRSEFEALATAHDAVEFLTLPHRSLEGREVFGVEVALGDRGDGRPMIYLDGCHHAREWPAADYCRQFAHHLVASLDNPRIRTVLERVVVCIVPVINVDGYVHSFSYKDTPAEIPATGSVAGGQGAYARKNNRVAPVDDAHVVDTGQSVDGTAEVDPHYGVDPNRNYPWQWGGTTRGFGFEFVPVLAATSPNPTDATYFGASPFSEPCTRNNYDYMRTRNIVVYLSNHTYSRLVLRPWGHVADPCPDEELLADLGGRMADAMADPAEGIPPYENVRGIDLYPTTGTASDWAYASLGALAFTLEHGLAFHPDYGRRHAPGVEWPKVMEAFTQAAEAAADPATHSIVSGRIVDRAGRPARPPLRLLKRHRTPYAETGPFAWGQTVTGSDGFDETIELPLRPGADGRFEWHVNPSTRPHVHADGGAELYELYAGDAKVFQLEVGRGATVDLGDIELP